ncbi:hypothetical protein ScalyP_jg30 [Parmales sp. scaly parma]|nr:hypothetical protein ScalyP_jg30 [Parmales sp. scaly parma]
MRENLCFSLGNVANFTTTHLTHIESLTTLFDDDQDSTQSSNPYDSSITFLNNQNTITSRTVLIDTNANYGAALSTFSSADGEGTIDVNEKINQMTLDAATATAKSSASSSVVGGLDGSWGGEVQTFQSEITDPFSSFRACNFQSLNNNTFANFNNGRSQPPPTQPEASANTLLPSSDNGRTIDWDAYMEEDKTALPPPPPSASPPPDLFSPSDKFLACGGVNGVTNWSDFLLNSKFGGPIYLPLPSWNFESSQNKNNEYYDGCWNGGNTSGGSISDCSLPPTFREDLLETMRKMLESCDSPKSLQIFTSTRNGSSFWSGVASSIANEFKEEVGSGVTIDISIDNDLKAEAEAEAEAAQGSSGAFANSELERRKFKRNLYTAVALYNKAQTFDVLVPVRLSQCLDLIGSSDTHKYEGLLFEATAGAALALESVFSPGRLANSEHNAKSCAVTVQNFNGAASAPCAPFQELVGLLKQGGRRENVIIEVDACFRTGAADHSMLDFGGGQGQGQDERLKMTQEVRYRREERNNSNSNIDRFTSFSHASLPSMMSKTSCTNVVHEDGGGTRGGHSYISAAASTRSMIGAPGSDALARKLYEHLSPGSICATSVKGRGLRLPNGYFSHLLKRLYADDCGVLSVATNSSRSFGWLKEEEVRLEEMLGLKLGGRTGTGLRGYLEAEASKGSLGEVEEVKEGLEFLRNLSECYDLG